jgi:hypothetical protein
MSGHDALTSTLLCSLVILSTADPKTKVQSFLKEAPENPWGRS